MLLYQNLETLYTLFHAHPNQPQFFRGRRKAGKEDKEQIWERGMLPVVKLDEQYYSGAIEIFLYTLWQRRLGLTPPQNHCLQPQAGLCMS